MRVIKHKTRRRAVRGIEPDTGYYVVEGVHSFGSIEEAVDVAIEVWAEEIKSVQPAPTLWDLYGRTA